MPHRGKGKEEYFVRRNGKWVPMEDDGPSRAPKGSSDYSVMMNGKWVKVDGANSTEDVISKLKRWQGVGHGTHRIRQAIQPQSQVYETKAQYIQNPVPTQPAPAPQPQQPIEYREYFVTFNNPPPPPQPPPQPLPEPRAEPNPYVERPPLRRMPPPRPRTPEPQPCIHLPPAPRPEVVVVDRPVPFPVKVPVPVPVERRPPEPVLDYYALGMEAARRDLEVERPYNCEDSGEDGYELAGFIYYGNPGEPAPILQPMPSVEPVPAPAYEEGQWELDFDVYPERQFEPGPGAGRYPGPGPTLTARPYKPVALIKPPQQQNQNYFQDVQQYPEPGPPRRYGPGPGPAVTVRPYDPVARLGPPQSRAPVARIGPTQSRTPVALVGPQDPYGGYPY